jgi:hypothetical protein
MSQVNVPIFNQDQLNKQRRQVINSAYVQLTYIQSDCKPYLSLFQQNAIPTLFTDDRLSFQLATVEDPLLDKIFGVGYTKGHVCNLSAKGRFVIFPAGNFKIFYNKKANSFTKEELVKLTKNWESENLSDIVTNNTTVYISCPKIYVLEQSMFKTIESKLKKVYLGK